MGEGEWVTRGEKAKRRKSVTAGLLRLCTTEPPALHARLRPGDPYAVRFTPHALLLASDLTPFQVSERVAPRAGRRFHPGERDY